MAWSPLGIHISGINEVSAVIEVVIKHYFGVRYISAKAKDIAA